MKFYCKNCESVFEPSREFFSWAGKKDDGSPLYCPFCQKETGIPIPYYETPEQCEKRTGKPIAKKTAVWFRIPENEIFDDWTLLFYADAKLYKDEAYEIPTVYIVIADPPVPPPGPAFLSE